MLNSMMRDDSEQRLTNIDHTLDLMDFDGSNDLDINEFFEVCKYFNFLLSYILILTLTADICKKFTCRDCREFHFNLLNYVLGFQNSRRKGW